MTLHYTKVGPSYLAETLDAAMEALDDMMDEDYLHFIRDRAICSEDAAAFASDGARAYVRETSPGLWSISLDGICPTGRLMCETGGAQLSSHNNPYYAAVPMDAKNCASCKFFVTGPLFLNGLVISFNNSVFEIGERARTLNKLVQELVYMKRDGVSKRKTEQQRSQIDSIEIEIEINQLLRSLQAKSQLIERSRAMLQQFKHDRICERETLHQPAILTRMLQDDISIVLESTTDFDLLEFVSQSC